jgi:hypothetical protein
MNYSDIESIAAIARDKYSAIPVLLGLAIAGFNDLRNSSRHNSQKKAAAEATLARSPLRIAPSRTPFLTAVHISCAGLK